MIAKSHIGITVFFVFPTPNGRKLPSLLYKKFGLIKTNVPNKIKYIEIATEFM